MGSDRETVAKAYQTALRVSRAPGPPSTFLEERCNRRRLHSSPGYMPSCGRSRGDDWALTDWIDRGALSVNSSHACSVNVWIQRRPKASSPLDERLALIAEPVHQRAKRGNGHWRLSHVQHGVTIWTDRTKILLGISWRRFNQTG